MKTNLHAEKHVDWSLYVDHTISFREHHTVEHTYQEMLRFGVDFAVLLDSGHKPAALIRFRQLVKALNAKFGHAVLGRKLLGDVVGELIASTSEATIFSTETTLSSARQQIQQLLTERKFDDIVGVSKTGVYLGLISIRDFIRRENQRLHDDREALKAQIDELGSALNDLSQPGSALVDATKIDAQVELALGVVRNLEEFVSTLEVTQDRVEAVTSEIDLQGNPEKAKQQFHVLETNVEMGREATDQLRRIVRVLRTLARPDGHTHQATNISDLVALSILQLSSRFGSQVSVQSDISPTEVILCYPRQICLLLVNLLSQAFTAMAGHGEISVELVRGIDHVELSIRYGSAAQSAAHDFDLSLSRRIVESNHRGAVSRSAVSDHSAQILIKLPSAPLDEAIHEA